MSSKVIAINPGQSFEIFKHGNVIFPNHYPLAIIKNNGMAPIRAVNYWAPPIGDYNQYGYIDVYPGEEKTFLAPVNAVYFYKIIVTNLSTIYNAEIEVTSQFWNW
ncbi:hypothetical protein V2H77_00860 [Photorhabdus sp. P32]|uniref:Uncharacterized protein n=2 Tax=Photorhabdus TaxID=29487 RepID=A0A1B8YNS2_9GAMM|nr:MULTISPECIES: hypothetical protein [Photorhabdus]EYU16071.1 hypothetical protein BA1DRAFT_01408 [Photorhabdus aegyptia]MBS9425718.1 hypothetical protein [Photorhabdus caribbeanensis]MCW7549785.1 hypothetical protein [Photorhabdus aballayi]OCA56749.1 hypothetical protein Phpb_00133 [Photorhabdus namnaonensis]